MEGKVKWFSEVKGFGFIIGIDNIERFFSVTDINGLALPKNGASVTFEAKDGKKGPIATKIAITENTTNQNDDRVTCSSCDKKMIPRIIIKNGLKNKSICPFCGSTFKRFIGNIIGWIQFFIFVYIVLALLFFPK